MQTFTRLLGFLRPHLRGVIVSFLFAAAAMGAGVSIPWLTGQAIGAITDGDRSQLVLFALLVASPARCGSASASAAASSPGASRSRSSTTCAQRLYSHLQSLELGFFDRQQTGQLMSRVTVDLQAVRFFLGYGLIFIGQSFFTLALAAVAMLIIDPQLALIALAPVPFVDRSSHSATAAARAPRCRRSSSGSPS